MRTAIRILLDLGLVPLVLVCSGCPEREEKPEEPKDAQPSVAHEVSPAETAYALPGAWEPDVRDHLLKLIATHGEGGADFDASNPPVVVFDFDNTCIRGDIGRAFFDWMIKERKIRFDQQVLEALPAGRRAHIQAAWNELSKLPPAEQPGSAALQKLRKFMHQAYWNLCQETRPEKCFPWQVRFYAGHRPQDVVRMAVQVMKQELKRPLGSERIAAEPDDATFAITSTGIRIHEEIKQLMSLMRRKGFKVWIVTAGPQWVVTGAARHFAISPDQVIGMRTRLAQGKITTEIDPPPTFKQGKVKAIEKFIGVKPVLAVGDSWTDAEMLSYAQHALLIDRGYADLKKKAIQAGWWIQPTFPVQ